MFGGLGVVALIQRCCENKIIMALHVRTRHQHRSFGILILTSHVWLRKLSVFHFISMSLTNDNGGRTY